MDGDQANHLTPLISAPHTNHFLLISHTHTQLDVLSISSMLFTSLRLHGSCRDVLQLSSLCSLQAVVLNPSHHQRLQETRIRSTAPRANEDYSEKKRRRRRSRWRKKRKKKRKKQSPCPQLQCVYERQSVCPSLHVNTI